MDLKFDQQFRDVISLFPASIAILDLKGTILCTNYSGEWFALENGIGDLSQVSPGVDYLEICRKAGEESGEFLTSLQKILEGKLKAFTLEYPCHAPDQ